MRPRDLYDVIILCQDAEVLPAAAVLLDVLRQKCVFKSVEVPKWSALDGRRDDLVGGDWQRWLLR